MVLWQIEVAAFGRPLLALYLPRNHFLTSFLAWADLGWPGLAWVKPQAGPGQALGWARVKPWAGPWSSPGEIGQENLPFEKPPF